MRRKFPFGPVLGLAAVTTGIASITWAEWSRMPAPVEGLTVSAERTKLLTTDRHLKDNPHLWSLLSTLYRQQSPRGVVFKVWAYPGGKPGRHPAYRVRLGYDHDRVRLAAYPLQMTGDGRADLLLHLRTKHAPGSVTFEVPAARHEDGVFILVLAEPWTEEDLPGDVKDIVTLDLE